MQKLKKLFSSPTDKHTIWIISVMTVSAAIAALVEIANKFPYPNSKKALHRLYC